MRLTFIIAALSFLTNIPAFANDLCLSNEDRLFSFKTKLEKILSICTGPHQSYLVYRYGYSKNIEMQFPKHLDQSSWRKFQFYGRRRVGGRSNAGFGDYSLSFQNSATSYTVFQHWSDEDETYSIGVTIASDRKLLTVLGLKSTQKGSLTFLNQHEPLLKNSAD